MNNFYWFGCFKDKELQHGWEIVRLPNGDYQWVIRKRV